MAKLCENVGTGFPSALKRLCRIILRFRRDGFHVRPLYCPFYSNSIVGDGFPVPFRPYSAQKGRRYSPLHFILSLKTNCFRERKLISDENERNKVKRGANRSRGLPHLKYNLSSFKQTIFANVNLFPTKTSGTK